MIPDPSPAARAKLRGSRVAKFGLQIRTGASFRLVSPLYFAPDSPGAPEKKGRALGNSEARNSRSRRAARAPRTLTSPSTRGSAEAEEA
jgi:hypothetical protein